MAVRDNARNSWLVLDASDFFGVGFLVEILAANIHVHNENHQWDNHGALPWDVWVD